MPHHSRAIMMCGRATITDPEIKAPCDEIISSQTREIEQLKAIYGAPVIGLHPRAAPMAVHQP
ncbi:MAG: hypothetical protein WKF52_05960, partial [Sphingomicrobium sp.]